MALLRLAAWSPEQLHARDAPTYWVDSPQSDRALRRRCVQGSLCLPPLYTSAELIAHVAKMARAGALVGMLAPLVGAAAAGGGKRRREGRGGAQPARALFRLRPLQGRRDGRREAGTNFSAHLRCCAAQGTRSSCPRSLLHGSRAAGDAGAGRPRSAASPSRLIARQTGPAFARALPALPLPPRVRGWAVCPSCSRCPCRPRAHAS